MARVITINDLPNEILIEVFSYLPFKDLVYSVQDACLRWKHVSQDILLWKRRSYCPDFKESDDQIVDILQRVPNLRTFILLRPVSARVLNALLQNCPKIRDLEFSGSQKINYKLLQNLLRTFNRLHRLAISIFVLGRRELAYLLGQFKYLKTLKFSDMTYESDEPMYLFFKPVAIGCPSLEHCDIHGKNILYNELAYFIEKKGHQLQHLGVQWSSEDGKCNLPLLSKCTSLKSLYIDSYWEIEAEKGFNTLKNISTLTSLTLYDLHNADFNSVLNVFNHGSMSQLQEFSLIYFSNYEDKFTQTLVQNCPRLRLLCFEQCHTMTDCSLEPLYLLPELQTLMLWGADVTDIGITYLKKCRNLSFLSLQNCVELRESGMQDLANFNNLQTLILDFCVVRGLPLHLFPDQMKHLMLLSINYCQGVEKDSVINLKKKMPHLTVKDEMPFVCTVADDWEIVGEVNPEVEDVDLFDCFLLDQLK